MSTIKLRRGTAAQWTAANPALAAGEPGFETDTGKHKIGNGADSWSDLEYFLPESALSATFVPAVREQAAEGASAAVWRVDPVTAGHAPFEVRFNSFDNAGGGAGTKNHALHMGFNVGRHNAATVQEPGRASWYMGFEDNYHDDDDDLTTGPEWYIGYITPDGSTVEVGDLRPFYVRLRNGNTNNAADKSAKIMLDIGSGPDGSLGVWGSAGSGIQVLHLDKTQVVSYVPFSIVGASGQVIPLTGPASFLIQSPDEATAQDATLTFGVGGAAKFQFIADRFGEIFLWDNTNNRIQVNFIRGPSSAAATMDVRAMLQLNTEDGAAAAGSAAALPATPQGYFTVKDSGGVIRKVPFYV